MAMVGLVVLLADHLCAAAPTTLQAGVARQELTPPLEMKAALGGYETSVSFYGETLGRTVIDGAVGVAAGLK